MQGGVGATITQKEEEKRGERETNKNGDSITKQWREGAHTCAAMVPGLVLFKVKQGSRKKEQIYGFYIQIKNILTTFPQKISKFGP